MHTPLVLLAPLILAQPLDMPASSPADTITLQIRAAVPPVADPDAPATVVFDLGAGPGAPAPARSLEFGMSGLSPAAAGDQPLSVAQVKLVRTPDSLSGELARRVGTRMLLPSVEVLLPGGGGAPAVLVRLYDVKVVSTRLVTSADTLGLAQQRIALQESVAQLTVDLAEARRQFDVAESLEKQRLSASLDLARARGHMEALTQRLAAAHERLALVRGELARWTPVQEELVLSATRAEVATHR